MTIDHVIFKIRKPSRTNYASVFFFYFFFIPNKYPVLRFNFNWIVSVIKNPNNESNNYSKNNVVIRWSDNRLDNIIRTKTKIPFVVLYLCIGT